MASRFWSNISLTVLGAMFLTMSLVFGPSVVGWLALGFGCAAVGVTLVGFACGGRGRFQRSIDATVAVLGGWTIVSARSFTGTALRWLSFSEAVALLALSVIGLLAHEILVERALRRQTDAAARDGRRPVELRQPAAQRERIGALSG